MDFLPVNLEQSVGEESLVAVGTKPAAGVITELTTWLFTETASWQNDLELYKLVSG